MDAPTRTGSVTGTPLLNAFERRDCCPARAQVSVVLRSGLDLAFCRHHANELRESLAPQTVCELEPTG
ncbi:MAG: hypothetical protein ACLGIV_13565 [Actinomycetes bacterium]